MTAMDFNSFTGQQRTFDLIPHGTEAVLQTKVRPGGAGEGGWLKRAKDGNSEALDFELTVIGGLYDKKKLWELLTVDGTTEGHKEAAKISNAKICAILESARGIKPNDTSETARQGRQLNSYGDLDGLRFIAKVGIEKGGTRPNGDGTFPDKNRVLEVITPDRKSWHKVDQPPPPPSGALVTPPPASNSGQAIQRPQWSK